MRRFERHEERLNEEEVTTSRCANAAGLIEALSSVTPDFHPL